MTRVRTGAIVLALSLAGSGLTASHGLKAAARTDLRALYPNQFSGTTCAGYPCHTGYTEYDGHPWFSILRTAWHTPKDFRQYNTFDDRHFDTLAWGSDDNLWYAATTAITPNCGRPDCRLVDRFTTGQKIAYRWWTPGTSRTLTGSTPYQRWEYGSLTCKATIQYWHKVWPAYVDVRTPYGNIATILLTRYTVRRYERFGKCARWPPMTWEERWYLGTVATQNGLWSGLVRTAGRKPGQPWAYDLTIR
jgi:hypothetical protein